MPSLRGLAPWLGLALAVTGAKPASGDGGQLRIRQPFERRIVSVWTAPTPLRVGAVEVLVVLEPVPGAPFESPASIAVEARSDGRPLATTRDEGDGGNPAGPHLFRVHAEAPGTFDLRVRIGAGSDIDEVATTVPVEPPLSPLREQWAALGLPVLAAALFALRLWRERERRRGDATLSGSAQST